MYKVLLTDMDWPSLEIEEQILSPLGAEIRLASSTDERTLIAEANDCVAIMVDRALVSDKVIASAARGGCRAIVRYGIGYDNVDIESADHRGIPVANVPDYCLDEVADHTIALLLAHTRRILEATSSVRSGRWDVPKGSVPRLAGRRLGLIGMGRIGRRVATRALAFGLVVDAYDPITSIDVPGVTTVTSLQHLLETADYISLHAALNDSTRHLVDAKALSAMRRKPLLINTSRGGLVDLDAVGVALESGTLSGVALDVFDSEPLAANHPLRTNPMAIITPHMSYYSNESEPELHKRVAEEVARALQGEPLLNPVTKIRVASVN
jgi:D-3-phosphoglycerate dehydrogenase / 2-oxoglutarate reductase